MACGPSVDTGHVVRNVANLIPPAFNEILSLLSVVSAGDAAPVVDVTVTTNVFASVHAPDVWPMLWLN